MHSKSTNYENTTQALRTQTAEEDTISFLFCISVFPTRISRPSVLNTFGPEIPVGKTEKQNKIEISTEWKGGKHTTERKETRHNREMNMGRKQDKDSPGRTVDKLRHRKETNTRW